MSINFTDKKPGDFGVVDKPQSDLEKFIDLYRSVGIELEPVVSDKYDAQYGYQHIDLSNGLPSVNGMAASEIYFDESGKFIQQGIWE